MGWVAEQYDPRVAEELVRELASLSAHAAVVEVATAHPDHFSMHNESVRRKRIDETE